MPVTYPMRALGKSISHVALPTLQDSHGIPLLAYAAGIGYPRMNKLLDILLEYCEPLSLGLISCARSTRVSLRAATIPVLSLLSPPIGRPLGESLERPTSCSHQCIHAGSSSAARHNRSGERCPWMRTEPGDENPSTAALAKVCSGGEQPVRPTHLQTCMPCYSRASCAIAEGREPQVQAPQSCSTAPSNLSLPIVSDVRLKVEWPSAASGVPGLAIQALKLHSVIAWLSHLRAVKRSSEAARRAAFNMKARVSVTDRLEEQQAMCAGLPWDWHTTAGLSGEYVVWSCLELAMLANYPSRTHVCFCFFLDCTCSWQPGTARTYTPALNFCKNVHVDHCTRCVQAVLQCLVSEAFTGGSGLGVMPVMAILAVKYPKSAAHVVPRAPMQCIHEFYISNLSEKDLDPLVSETSCERVPASIEVRFSWQGCVTEQITSGQHQDHFSVGCSAWR
jgi:hypothetical protein